MEVDSIPISEQRAMVRPQHGSSRIYLEDRAIKAYHDALEGGASEDEARKQYFEVFKNGRS